MTAELVLSIVNLVDEISPESWSILSGGGGITFQAQLLPIWQF